jgi:hypothetical protein
MLKKNNRQKLMRHILTVTAALFITAGCAHLSNRQSAKDELRNSVVRITSTTQSPYFYSPWIWRPPQRISGEGIVVGKDLVMTLASTVKNATLIELTMGTEPVPTQMKVVAVNYNANIALLKGKLPETAKPIKIPATSKFTRSGALNLYWKTSTGMIIEGNAILDRVDTRYNFDSLQAISMMKAVKSTQPNMGYGIPVFDNDNKFFGLAIKGGGEYNFYILTCDTINRTLDIAKGKTKEPTAVAGFTAKPLTQVYYRQKLGLTEDNGGCLISKVFGQGSGSDQLEKGDVLLSICGHKLDAWGKYKHPEFGQLSYTHLFSEHYLSDKFPVTIMRDKQEQKLNLDLSEIDDSSWLIRTNSEMKPSQYIIRGGFIFIPLTKTYLYEWGGNFANKAPMPLVSIYNDKRYEIKTPEKQEYVLISRVLSHPTNMGMQNITNMTVEEVNGKPLKNLKELAEILNDPENDVLKLKLSSRKIPLWLSKKVLKSADQEIMQRYGIYSLQNLK